MKAFIVDRYGKRRALRSAEMPTPEPREDEVLVQVHAAGVNLLDCKIRDGEFKLILPYHLPLILGHDVAGVVVRIGPRVQQFKPGDEVYARPDDFRIGTFLSYGEGRVQYKFGYYHLSSHVGDEYLIKHPTFQRINFRRETIVLGVGYYLWEDLRVYAEVGYAPSTDGGSEAIRSPRTIAPGAALSIRTYRVSLRRTWFSARTS